VGARRVSASSGVCGCDWPPCGVFVSMAEGDVSRYSDIRARLSRHWIVGVSDWIKREKEVFMLFGRTSSESPLSDAKASCLSVCSLIRFFALRC
jgi:hypothetical protein